MKNMISIFLLLFLYNTTSYSFVCMKRFANFPRRRLEKFAEHSADLWGLDREIVKGVVFVESRWKICSTSDKGAIGLMQVMPSTASEMGFIGEDYSRLFYPRKNLYYGCRYLKKMLDLFGGDYKLALAAYYAGPGFVDKVLKRNSADQYIVHRVYDEYVTDVINSMKN